MFLKGGAVPLNSESELGSGRPAVKVQPLEERIASDSPSSVFARGRLCQPAQAGSWQHGSEAQGPPAGPCTQPGTASLRPPEAPGVSAGWFSLRLHQWWGPGVLAWFQRDCEQRSQSGLLDPRLSQSLLSQLLHPNDWWVPCPFLGGEGRLESNGEQLASGIRVLFKFSGFSNLLGYQRQTRSLCAWPRFFFFHGCIVLQKLFQGLALDSQCGEQRATGIDDLKKGVISFINKNSS